MSSRRNGGTSLPDEPLPPDDDSPAARAARALRQISQMLGVSPEAFLNPAAEAASAYEPASEEECAELVKAYRRIGNAGIRRRYLGVLRSLAEL